MTAKLSETEKAMDQQSGLLGRDWSEQLGKKARAALKGARALTFIGTGTSYHAALWAEWLCRTASQGKVPSRALTSWDFIVGGYAKTVARDELLVVISHRGDRALSKRVLAEIGRRRHVLICGEDAPTGSHPYIYTSPQELSQAHTMSLVGAMGAASELVASVVPAREARRLREEREVAAVLVQALGAEIEELSNALGGLFTRGSVLHIVGGGPLHAVALELALKAREIIHATALGYNTEEFLHGPITAVEEEDTLIVLEPFGKPRSPVEKELYVKRSASCRAAAEAIGALVLEPSWPRSVATRAAGLSLAWQALLPLYWGQVLCVATAKAWNINPDLNRRDDPRYEDARTRAEAAARR